MVNRIPRTHPKRIKRRPQTGKDNTNTKTNPLHVAKAACTAGDQNMCQNASMEDLTQLWRNEIPFEYDPHKEKKQLPQEATRPGEKQLKCPLVVNNSISNGTTVVCSPPSLISTCGSPVNTSPERSVRAILKGRAALRSRNAAAAIAFLTGDSEAEQQRQLVAFRARVKRDLQKGAPHDKSEINRVE